VPVSLLSMDSIGFQLLRAPWMASRHKTMAFSIHTDRLSLRLRTKTDAACTLELLGEHDRGTTMSIGEVEQRLLGQNEQAQFTTLGS
jgi:hypothetical protein